MRLDENFPFSPRKWPFFYGYFIVFCSTLGMVLSAPGQTVGVSVFTDYLIQHLGLSRFQLSLAYTIGTIGSAFLIIRTGKLLDSGSVRIVAFFSTCFLGMTLVYLSQVDYIAGYLSNMVGQSYHIFTAMICITIGFVSLRYFGQGLLALASRTMLMKWFIDKRGRVNSIMGVFISLTFSAAPLFFDLLIQRFGWRGAWIVMGLLIGFVFSIILAIFFRDTPEACRLYPDGNKEHTSLRNLSVEEENWTLAEVKRSKTFWIFNLTIAMAALLITALTFHVVSIFKMAGLAREEAISIFLPSSVIAVILNIIAGWLCDWEPFKYKLKYLASLMSISLLLVGVGIMTLEAGTGKYWIIIGNGIASGLFGTLSNIPWPRFFGRKHLGEITGYNMSYIVFFSAIGPSIFGWSFGYTKSYHWAAGICIFIQIVLLVASFKADRPHLKVTGAISSEKIHSD